MAGRREEIEAERAEAARRALAGSSAAELIGHSNLAQTGADAEANPEERADSAEIWGRRVGRGLGYLAVVVLLIYLAVTYAFV